MIPNYGKALHRIRHKLWQISHLNILDFLQNSFLGWKYRNSETQSIFKIGLNCLECLFDRCFCFKPITCMYSLTIYIWLFIESDLWKCSENFKASESACLSPRLLQLRIRTRLTRAHVRTFVHIRRCLLYVGNTVIFKLPWNDFKMTFEIL